MEREQKLIELAKIAGNPLEWLKYVKIMEPGRGAIKFELWPHLITFFRALEFYKLILVVKPKQVGISWSLASHAERHIYTLPYANVLQLSKGQLEAQSLLEKSKFIYHNLPDWMHYSDWDPPTPIICEPDSSEALGFKHMHSKLRALPSTEFASIGETCSLFIGDEADFHPHAEVNYGHARATIEAGGQHVLVSTIDQPHLDTLFKRLVKQADEGLSGYHLLFFPYDVRPGRDEAWREEQERNAATPWEIGQNYPRSLKEAMSPITARSFFAEEAILSLWENAIDSDEGHIHILHKPKVGVHYSAGVDVGKGVGLDYSVLTIIGRYGLQSEVAAVIYTNEIETDLFALEVKNLCNEYFNPLLAIENNAIGVAVCNKIQEVGYENLFYSDDKKKTVGWTTSAKNKELALIELKSSINDGSLITRFKPQVKELMEFQWIEGKPEPTGKTHGDTVISLMLANEMLSRAHGPYKATLYVGGQLIYES